MSMLEFPVETIIDGTGQEHQAYTATCRCADGSEGDVFFVFQAAGTDHFHLLCAQCEQHYCPFGRCVLPLNPPPEIT
jgi:hypothetical protein